MTLDHNHSIELISKNGGSAEKKVTYFQNYLSCALTQRNDNVTNSLPQ
jgi:hypothetical protein